MLQRMRAIEADARRERIGDEREEMLDLALAVVVRDRLHRRRAGGDHEIVAAGRHLPCDGHAGRHVTLRVEPFDREGIAVVKAARREAVDGAANAFVEHRGIRVLKDGDALGFASAAARRACAMLAIGEQQRGGGGCDQQHTQSETFDRVQQFRVRVRHLVVGCGQVSNRLRRESGEMRVHAPPEPLLPDEDAGDPLHLAERPALVRPARNTARHDHRGLAVDADVEVGRLHHVVTHRPGRHQSQKGRLVSNRAVGADDRPVIRHIPADGLGVVLDHRSIPGGCHVNQFVSFCHARVHDPSLCLSKA
jgi:hypothetical protein